MLKMKLIIKLFPVWEPRRGKNLSVRARRFLSAFHLHIKLTREMDACAEGVLLCCEWCFCEAPGAGLGEDPWSPLAGGGGGGRGRKKLWEVLWVGGGNSPLSDRRLAARTGKMARRCGRATSRFTGEIQIHPRKTATSAVWLCFCLLFPSAAEAGLYSVSDQIIFLTPDNVERVLMHSTAAVVVEFYASWCGHCVAFSPVYKSLARDIKGWYRPAARHVAAAAYNGN